MSTESVDDVIVRFLEHGDDAARMALAETGLLGLDRILDLCLGRAAGPLAATPGMPSGKDAVDAQSAALYVVACAHPSEFIDAIQRETIPYPLAILGDIDDPRATGILCGHLDDENWLTRYNAIAALGRRSDDAAKLCAERCLADPHLVVRSKAIEAVSKWDSGRARQLYGELLAADGLTPLLRQIVESALRDL